MHKGASTEISKARALHLQELQALQELLQAFYGGASPAAIIFTAVGILRAHTGIESIGYIHLSKDKKSWNFKILGFPSYSQDIFQELLYCTESGPPLPHHVQLKQARVEYIIPLGVQQSNPTAWFILSGISDKIQEEWEHLKVFLQTAGDILTVFLDNLYLLRLRHKQELLKRELQVASEIQNQILPRNRGMLLGNQVEYAYIHEPHEEVSGDLLDIIPIGTDEFFFYVADVKGKGISAGMLMANLHGHIRGLVSARHPLRYIARQIHGQVAHLAKSDSFVTIFLGQINLYTRRLTYLNAAHPPPFLYRNKTIVARLEPQVHPLGILPLQDENSLTPESLSLEKGDFLVLYTDGLTDQLSPEDIPLDVLPLQHPSTLRSQTPQEFTENIYALYRAHRGNKPSQDDLTIFAIYLAPAR
ncbi:MAG: PP2C family protein-serine/threonine phosphatase [Bacteroidia bacterium]